MTFKNHSPNDEITIYKSVKFDNRPGHVHDSRLLIKKNLDWKSKPRLRHLKYILRRRNKLRACHTFCTHKHFTSNCTYCLKLGNTSIIAFLCMLYRLYTWVEILPSYQRVLIEFQKWKRTFTLLPIIWWTIFNSFMYVTL